MCVATVSFPVYLYPVQVTSRHATFSLGNHTCFDFLGFASLQFGSYKSKQFFNVPFCTLSR